MSATPADAAALARFAYAPGSHTYDVRSEAQIELAGTGERETVSMRALVSYTVARGPRAAAATGVTGAVDSVAIQASARVAGGDAGRTAGAAEPRAQAPIRFRATVIPAAPSTRSTAAGRAAPIELVDGAPRCALPNGATEAAALTVARETVVRVPAAIPVGGQWRDSVTTPGCSGEIATTVTAVSRYEVVGITTVDGVRVVRVRRTTNSTLRGQAIARGRPVVVSGAGAGEGVILLDAIAGRLVSSEGEVRGTVRVTVGQNVGQEFSQRVRTAVELRRNQ